MVELRGAERYPVPGMECRASEAFEQSKVNFGKRSWHPLLKAIANNYRLNGE